METEIPSASAPAAAAAAGRVKESLGWMEWLRGWMAVVYEFLFQRITASHLENPMELPPVNDLTCIITGSTSGIGLQMARQLAQFGAHVVMAVRNTKRANGLIQQWQNEMSGTGILLNIEVMQVDLLSLDSVAKFAEAWNARSVPLHVLINNAGIFMLGESQKFSKDGYEQHLQVNHLAPALLSVLLLPSLLRGSPSRIVNVNSVMHYVGFVDPNDMNVTSGKRKFSSYVGYTSSKLAQVMFSSMLHKRVPAEAGISIVCVSPGVVDTNVARDLPGIVQTAYHLIPYFVFSPAEGNDKRSLEMIKGKATLYLIYGRRTYQKKNLSGARSSLFSATDPQIQEYCETLKADEWPTCAYVSHDCRPTNPSEEAHNTETSLKVWEKTLELIGLPPDAVERLIEGEQIKCQYGAHTD
ncbi:hypothetical protein QQ045_014909 [Rhodiola kirilowii]